MKRSEHMTPLEERSKMKNDITDLTMNAEAEKKIEQLKQYGWHLVGTTDIKDRQVYGFTNPAYVGISQAITENVFSTIGAEELADLLSERCRRREDNEQSKMKTEYTAGDVVQLKAGGPPMTINKIGPTEIECVWFDGNKLKRHGFKSTMLCMVVVVEAQMTTDQRTTAEAQLKELLRQQRHWLDIADGGK